ncbi:MAG TPA: hypothetical protein VGQ42_17020 [Candidatus Dormibacteraeota bacterium]|nr:hypothetical protein [Candidatus Dormibacteraeota bacterium]
MRLRTDPRSGAPAAVELRGAWRTVARVEEVWRVDDGWWRPHPVQRTYFRLALDDGRALTLYREQADAGAGARTGGGAWWQQRY